MNPRLGNPLLLFVMLAVAPAARPLHGQSGTVLVSATVVTDRLGAAVVRPLAFETSRRAHDATIPPRNPASAQWRLMGDADMPVVIKFTLPAELVNLQSPQSGALPIAFSRQAGRWSRATGGADAGFTFDPRQGTVIQFGSGPLPTADVWLGASVVTTAVASGAYGGTVTMTIFYY